MTHPNTTDTTSDSTHRDPTDLLTDGEVDISEVRSITSAFNDSDSYLTPKQCADIRSRVLECQHASRTAGEFGVGSTAVRRHVRGDCHHAEDVVDHPPLTYARGEGWSEVDPDE